jgi:hypothetical protein
MEEWYITYLDEHDMRQLDCVLAEGAVDACRKFYKMNNGAKILIAELKDHLKYGS